MGFELTGGLKSGNAVRGERGLMVGPAEGLPVQSEIIFGVVDEEDASVIAHFLIMPWVTVPGGLFDVPAHLGTGQTSGSPTDAHLQTGFQVP